MTMLNKNLCTLPHVQTVQSLSDWDNLPDDLETSMEWKFETVQRITIVKSLVWGHIFSVFLTRHSQAKIALRLYTSYNYWLESLPGCQASTCGQVQAPGPTSRPKTVEVRKSCEELNPFSVRSLLLSVRSLCLTKWPRDHHHHWDGREYQHSAGFEPISPNFLGLTFTTYPQVCIILAKQKCFSSIFDNARKNNGQAFSFTFALRL